MRFVASFAIAVRNTSLLVLLLSHLLVALFESAYGWYWGVIALLLPGFSECAFLAQCVKNHETDTMTLPLLITGMAAYLASFVIGRVAMWGHVLGDRNVQ